MMMTANFCLFFCFGRDNDDDGDGDGDGDEEDVSDG